MSRGISISSDKGSVRKSFIALAHAARIEQRSAARRLDELLWPRLEVGEYNRNLLHYGPPSMETEATGAGRADWAACFDMLLSELRGGTAICVPGQKAARRRALSDAEQMKRTVFVASDKGGVGKSLVFAAHMMASEQLSDARRYYECEQNGPRLGTGDRYGDDVKFYPLPTETDADFDEGSVQWAACFDPLLQEIRTTGGVSVDFGANIFGRFLGAARNGGFAKQTDGGANVAVAVVATTAPDPLESAFATVADLQATLPRAKIFWIQNNLNGRFEDLRGTVYEQKLEALNVHVIRMRHLDYRGWKFVQALPLDKLAEFDENVLEGVVGVEEAARSTIQIKRFVLHLIKDVGMPIAKWASGQD